MDNQRYVRRLAQLEIVEEILFLLDKHDVRFVREKLQKLYVELQEELRALRRKMDPLLSSLTV